MWHLYLATGGGAGGRARARVLLDGFSKTNIRMDSYTALAEGYFQGLQSIYIIIGQEETTTTSDTSTATLLYPAWATASELCIF